MKIEIITKDELEHFKANLLNLIKDIVSGHASIQNPPKSWYKAAEVKKLLGISAGKLQQLRIKGQLRSSKIGGVHYYRWEDIDALFQQRNSAAKKTDNE